MKDALRFADLLSKSAHTPTADRDRLWGQEIAILLRLLYPEDESVKYYLGSVLSAVGNYRGLRAKTVEGFESEDLLDQIFYEYDKEEHRIPGKIDEYFFNDQMLVYKGMKEKFFSYSGPTSMGKSFVVQTYIQQEIENGSTDNFAILVPTKALINEVRSNLIGALQTKLKELNYRIVTASGDLVLQQDRPGTERASTPSRRKNRIRTAAMRPSRRTSASTRAWRTPLQTIPHICLERRTAENSAITV